MKTTYARTVDTTFTVELHPDGRARVAAPKAEPPIDAHAHYLGHGRVELSVDGRRALAWAVDAGDTRWVFVDGELMRVEVSDRPSGRGRAARTAGPESLGAPMPATVVRILVAPGQQVMRGQTLLLLEAMKMELPLRAPHDATVQGVRCAEGDLVQPGAVLVDLSGN